MRSFLAKPVEHAAIGKILEIARMAPSAVNYQPWCFVVVTQPESLAALHEAYPRNWFREAPACIVVCADHAQSWKRKSDGKDFADVDVAIVTDHIILKATELGLGTCWVCNFDPTMARQKLNLPDQIEPLVFIPMGYTLEQCPEKSRKSVESLVHWERYTNLIRS